MPGTDPQSERDLEGILSRSQYEVTPDGFEYFVADLDPTVGISTGRVVREPNRSELTLVLSNALPKGTRLKIAQTTVDTELYLDEGRYGIAKAIKANLSWFDNESFAQNIAAINALIVEMHGQMGAILGNPTISAEYKRRIREEGRSALGMLATITGLSDAGAHALDELSSQELWLPHSDRDPIDLQAFMRTPRGTEKVRFRMMPEKSDKHHCANCSGHIIPHSDRVTLVLSQSDGYSDHHHYHFPCFASAVMPRMDMKTIEPVPARQNQK